MGEMTDQEIADFVQRMEEREAEENPKARKRVRGDALTRLCKASARTVRENSPKIIDSLYQGVLQGDVSCAKLLVVLIEKLPPPKPRREKHNRTLEMIRELKNAPEWTGPLPSEMPDPADEDEQAYY